VLPQLAATFLFDQNRLADHRHPAAPWQILALLYGPAARCKPKMIDLEKLVLRFCIRPIDGALRLLAIMDYPRAFDLIRVSAPKARRAT
jgi:hypothetical protein